jgi:transcriptional regulator with XRE-family HTH domain
MVERIRTLLESRHLTPTQFADLIGVARPIVSHILSGRNKPSLEVVQRILAAMPELAMPWLLNGSGPMLAAAGAAVPDAVPSVAAPVPASSGQAVAPVRAEAKGAVENHHNAAQLREEAAPALLLEGTTGPRAAKIIEPASRVSRPAPFKPTARPKRFVAAPSMLSAPDESVTPEAGNTAQTPLEPSAAPPHASAATVAAGALNPPAASLPTNEGAPTSAMADALFAGAEKPIRRIVIFYRDGSFADYQPE